MDRSELDHWPAGIQTSDLPVYAPRRAAPLGLWGRDGWAIKAYGIQSTPLEEDAPLIAMDRVQAAEAHVLDLLPLTREEGEFYKTGFAVLHEGALANWLLFQWWTHGDVWCQLLSYSDSAEPLNFKHSTRPIRACVYETAILWHEQKSWIDHVLNGNADRGAYLDDLFEAGSC